MSTLRSLRFISESQRNQSLTDRLRVLRRRVRLLFQISIGVAAAWLISTDALGHTQPFFAPIACVIAIMAGGGQRRRAAFELIGGVSVGILVGELLIHVIGRGAWQMSVVVILALVVATLLGLKGIALTQAVTSSVLLTAVIPVAAAGNPATTRFLDALVGGLVGLLMTIVIPRNPVRDIDREVQAILRRLSDVLTALARALRDKDQGQADAALVDARDMAPAVEAMLSTSTNAREIARLAPMRWKQREHVELYFATLRDIDNAVRDARVLARRIGAALRFKENFPADLEPAVTALATAVTIFTDDLAQREDFERARNELIQAARMATLALTGPASINTGAAIAQVRSLAADLLYASGFTRDQIDERLDFD